MDDLNKKWYTYKKSEKRGRQVMKEGNKIAKAFMLVLQIGLTMIVAVGLCTAAGYYIDNHFGCNLMIFFIALGVISGYSGCYSLIRQYIDMTSSRDKYDQMFSDWEQGEDMSDDAGIKGEDDDENKTIH